MKNFNFKKILKFGFYTFIPNFLINLYLMLKYKCIIHPGANIMFIKNIKIGKGTTIGKCDIIAQNKILIGKRCQIENGVVLNSKTGYIKIGDFTSINNFTIIHGNGGVSIGVGVAIAPSVKIIKNHYIATTPNILYIETTEKYTEIGDYSWICANVVIIDGVKIGSNAVVGANAFVNKDVDSDTIVGGVPIRLLKKRKYEEKN